MQFYTLVRKQLQRICGDIRSVLAGAHQQEPLSPILCLGVNPFPSRSVYRTALRGGFARIQFKDPIKTELDIVYCFTSHSPMI